MNTPKALAGLGALLVGAQIATSSAQEVVRPPTELSPRSNAPAVHSNPASAGGESAATAADAAPVAVNRGRIIAPPSSVESATDRGLRAHTNLMVFAPERSANITSFASTDFRSAVVTPEVTNPGSGAENPASIACVYKISTVPTSTGCLKTGTTLTTGGSGTIAIVDAYDNPDAKADFRAFSLVYGLPLAGFTQIYCQPYAGGTGTCNTSNTPPATNSGWGLEEALDIEWSHAMAPKAKILLIEAASNSYDDITWAVAWAGYYVDIGGGGEVSNSYGGSEFSGETGYDYLFNNFSGSYRPVVYLASGGDSSVVEYPSASPYVIAAGGTTINRDSSGNLVSETCWSGTGRGTSAYEPIPSWQSAVGGLGGTLKETTDLSAVADPNSGVWVYDHLNGGWFIVGGTSVSSPVLAGIINNSGNFLATSAEEGNLIYSEYLGKKTYSADFLDVTPTGYDNCTGIGAPQTRIGK